jgi:metal-dependent amidase/aminoacylase/carboxypeptidase family protein
VNDEKETARVFEVAEQLFGADRVKECPLVMAGEDFAYYLHQAPGCFMFVGAGNESQGIVYPHHHPRFDIDESSMRTAAELLIGMAVHASENG